MSISKSSLAAGILGAGGGAAGTVATVKYVTSISKQDQNNEELRTVKPFTRVVKSVEDSKKDIQSWKTGSGNCTIKVKLSQNSEAQDLDQINDQKELDSLAVTLSIPFGNVKSLCSDGKVLIATKGQHENEWKFSNQ